MRIAFYIGILLLSGCNPNPSPNPSPSDSTNVVDTLGIGRWQIMSRDEYQFPCGYYKTDGDSITIVSVEGCLSDPDMPYTILEDLRLEKRRMITIGSAYKTTADTSMCFWLDAIPSKIDYDKYSPNQEETGNGY